MELVPFLVQEKKIGYVEDRKRGQRIIIIIDDFFNLPDWHHLDPPPGDGTAFGLVKLYKVVREWDLTRGIGFFKLPRLSKIEEDSELIINSIQQWLRSVNGDRDDSVLDYYILVDSYYGTKDLVGHLFIEQWKARQVISQAHEKIAYLSTGGTKLGFSDPYNLPVFRKVEIDNAGLFRLTVDLEKWLDYEATPLEELWRKSAGWFDDAKSDVVRHDFSHVKRYFSTHDTNAKAYRQAIEDALGVPFPEAWWQDLDSFENIHNSLKTLCGEVFCGKTDVDGCRNMSVGAAYLVALKAHYDIYGNAGVLAENPSLWKDNSQVIAPIFPLQAVEKAQASAIALYEFFYRIFEGESSPVKKVHFQHHGGVLKVQVTWKATTALPGRKNLAQLMAERFESDRIDVPDAEGSGKMAKNTRDAITQLWRNMMFNKDGFMSPGVVYMEKNVITIASTTCLASGDSES